MANNAIKHQIARTSFQRAWNEFRKVQVRDKSMQGGIEIMQAIIPVSTQNMLRHYSTVLYSRKSTTDTNALQQ